MAEDSAGERTERGTPRRREKAREKGQVAKSQEVTSLFVLATGLLALLVLSRHLAEVIGRNTAYLLGQAHLLRVDNVGGLRAVLVGNLQATGLALAPLLGAVLVAAVGANVMQVGLKSSAAALAFDPARLNAITGMKRFFQKRTFFELAKTLVKVGLISGLAWLVIAGMLGRVSAAATLALPGVLHLARACFQHLVLVLLAFLIVLAVADWAYQRWQFEQDMRMSRQELREEAREFEGDPQVKARLRAIQFETARKRMLAEVPGADVVVANPTHFAVALKYAPSAAAPVVVAKGADLLAEKIKAVARAARVPVIENRRLARALYREVEVGRAIPEALYQAVAEILAYVYRLKKA